MPDRFAAAHAEPLTLFSMPPLPPAKLEFSLGKR